VEALAGQEEASRSPGPDPGEDERRDHCGDDSEPDLCEAEGRIRCGDDDVRAGDEPGAAAEGVALDTRDHGRRARVERREHLVQAERVLPVLFERKVDRSALPVDVGAGAEALSFAREQNDPRVAYVRERLRQLADQAGVEGVPPLGPREGDAQQLTVSLYE